MTTIAFFPVSFKNFFETFSDRKFLTFSRSMRAHLFSIILTLKSKKTRRNVSTVVVVIAAFVVVVALDDV